ncbi:MAG: hypothetical protein ACI89L_001937 [Phycisphaerales bacterium]|jgi:hypothetical protein
MNPTNTPPANTAAAKDTDGWLWASAAALVALVLLATTGAFDRSAYAEMTAATGGYAAVTTDGGSDEVLVVTDDRTESLMVYQVLSGKKLELLAKHELPDLFRGARVQFGQP